ncbi:MAG TPA: SUMF1/EgtB/PvdO family nonheme iron enzyme [Polyangiaceae bacterium]
MSWLGRAALASSAAVLLAPPRVEQLELRTPVSGMLRVPAGSFAMGSSGEDVLGALLDCQREPRSTECDPSVFGNEGPPRTVRLSAYWLDRTEVTVKDYARCVAVGRCSAIPFAEGARRFERPAYPASLLTWDEARNYCAFRGARLPTEAEFERAARGPSGRKYPWGNVYSVHASNHGKFSFDASDPSDGFAELAEVGSFPAGRTPEGFLDLAGNVSEWVSDRYAPTYSETDLVDPRGLAVSGSSPGRVVRGGSYESAAPWLRGAARVAMDPSTRRPTIGFRCARTAARTPSGASPEGKE